VNNINHPKHYGGDTTYEVIKVIEAWELGFSLGNAIKYIARAGKKSNDSLEDLQKAAWYLKREINKQVKDNGRSSLTFLLVSPHLDDVSPMTALGVYRNLELREEWVTCITKFQDREWTPGDVMSIPDGWVFCLNMEATGLDK
jgi:hypothetical protein